MAGRREQDLHVCEFVIDIANRLSDISWNEGSGSCLSTKLPTIDSEWLGSVENKERFVFTQQVIMCSSPFVSIGYTFDDRNTTARLIASNDDSIETIRIR